MPREHRERDVISYGESTNIVNQVVCGGTDDKRIRIGELVQGGSKSEYVFHEYVS